MNYIVFRYKDLIFDGIKLREDQNRYPWKNNKEANKLFDSLIKEGSSESKSKYVDLMEIQYEEDIHVKLSFSIISKVLCYLSLILSIVYLKYIMVSAIMILLGILLAFGFFYFKRKALELYVTKENCKDFVEILFIK